MTRPTLAITRASDGSASLKLKEQTIRLTDVGDGQFTADKDLPNLKTMATAALDSPPTFRGALTPETLQIQCASDDTVTELRVETTAKAEMGLGDILPDAFSWETAKDLPAHASDLAKAARATGFTHRFIVGSKQSFIGCAANVPKLAGGPVPGRVEIGVTAPLKSSGYSVAITWAETPQSVLFSQFLSQIGVEGTRALPSLRIAPRKVTYLNGGDVRYHARLSDLGQFDFDGWLELDYRGAKPWRLRMAVSADPSPLSLVYLIGQGGLPTLSRLPAALTGAQITNLSAELNLDARQFEVTGRATNLFHTQADLQLTYRAEATPSVRLRADLEADAPNTLVDVMTQSGLANEATELARYMPFADLPARLSSFAVDTRGPMVFGALKLGLDGGWGDINIAAGVTPDGLALGMQYEASADAGKSLGEVLSTDMMPGALRTQLNSLTHHGTAKPGLAKVLLDATLADLNLDVAIHKSGGVTTDLSAHVTLGGLPMRLEMTVNLSDTEKDLRLSMGILPGHYVTLDGLAEALAIPLDAMIAHLPIKALPTAKMAMQDLTIDTKRKRFSITAEAKNGFDAEAKGIPGYKAQARLVFVKKKGEFTFDCTLEGTDAPITLRALAADLQLDALSGALQNIGDIALSSCVLSLDSAKQRVEIGCSAKVSFGDLIRTAGVESLPHGMPTDLKLDGFSITIEHRKKVTLKGALELSGAETALFELDDDTKLDIAKLKFKMTRDGGAVKGKVSLSGTPKIDLTDDIRLHDYAFALGYEKGKDTKGWSLSGDVTAHLFGKRALSLHAEASRDGKKRKLAFVGKLETLARIALSVGRLAGTLNVTPDVAEQILSDLKDAKHIDARGQVAKGIDPKEDRFDLGLRPALAAYARPVIELIEDTSPFFSVAVANEKLVDIDPQEIKLNLDWTGKKRTTAMAVTSDLRLYAPGDAGAPKLTIEKGTLSVEHQSGGSKTEIDFTPEQAFVRLPPLMQFDLPKLNEGADGKVTVDAGNAKDFAIDVGFEKLWFKKTTKSWEVGGRGGLTFHNMPTQLTPLLSEKPKFEMTVGKNGLTLAVEDGFEPVIIPDLLAKIESRPEFALPKLGESCAKLARIDLNLSKEIVLGLDFGIALPEHLNEALGMPKSGHQLFRTWAMGDEGMIKGRLEFGSEGVSGQLKGNPFNDLKGVKVVEDDNRVASVEIDFDAAFGPASDGKTNGKLNVIMPRLALDLQNGSFKASGGYEINAATGLRLPLDPLREVLTKIGLNDWAKNLPSGFPIQSRELSPAGLRELFTDLGIDLPKELTPVLELWERERAKLPTRLQEALKVSVPNALDFDIDVTPDGGVSFAVAAGKRGDDAQPPLQFILPTVAGLQSMKLWKLSLGVAFGGTALKGEIDADIDLFDYTTMLGSMVLLDDPGTPPANLSPLASSLPRRDELQRTMVIDDFSYLIIIATIIPIPVPLFYRELAVISHGIEDVRVEMSASFPKPTFGFVEGLKLFSEAYSVLTQEGVYFKDVTLPLDLSSQSREEASGGEPLNLTFSAGPLYAQLPRYIRDNGRQVSVGVRKSYRLVDTLKLTKVLLNGGKHLVTGDGPGYLISAIPPEMRQNRIDMQFLEALDFKVRWALATPNEFRKAKEITLVDGHDAASVAATMLDAIEDTRSKANVPDQDDNGIVAFLRGEMGISSVMHFVAEGGMMIDATRGLMAMQIAGQIGPRNAPVLDAQFKGAIGVNADAKANNAGVRMRGDASVAICGSTLLRGKFDLSKGPNRADIHVYQSLGLEGGLLWVRADLRGHMSNGKFYLKAHGDLKIAMIRAEGNFEVDVTPNHTRIVAGAQVQIDHVFTAGFNLFAVGHGPQTQIKLNFDANLLSLVEISAGAGYHSGRAIEMEGKLKLVGIDVLSGAFTATPEQCSFSGRMTLIPEDDLFGLGAKVTQGRITATGAFMDATGNYKFGPFRGSCNIQIDVETQGPKPAQLFKVTLGNFLTSDADLVLLGKNENGKALLLSADMPKPMSLLSGLVTVSGDDYKSGPSAALQLTAVQSTFLVERFQLTGALTVLGMRTAAKVDVDGKKGCLAAKLTIKPVLLPQLTSQVRYNNDAFDMWIEDFHMTLDLGDILQRNMPGSPFPNVKMQNFGASVSLSNARISLNKTPARIKRDKEIEKRLKREKARAEAHKKLMNEVISTSGKLESRLEQAKVNLDDARKGNELDAEDKKSLLEIKEKLIKAENFLKESTNTYNAAVKSLTASEEDLLTAQDVYRDSTEPFRVVREKMVALEGSFQVLHGIEARDKTLATLYELLGKPGFNEFYDKLADDLKEKIMRHRLNLFPGKNAGYAYDIWDQYKHNLYWYKQGHKHHKDEYKRYEGILRNTIDSNSRKLEEPLTKAGDHYKKQKARKRSTHQKWEEAQAYCESALTDTQAVLAKRFVNSIESKRATDYEALRVNQEVQIPIPSVKTVSKSAPDRSGFRAHVSAKLTLTINVPGMPPKEFNFLDVSWFLEDAGHQGAEQSILDRLPEVISAFLAENFMTVVGQAFATIFELIDYMIKLIEAASRTGRRRASVTQAISAEQFLGGYLDITEAQAATLIAHGR